MRRLTTGSIVLMLAACGARGGGSDDGNIETEGFDTNPFDTEGDGSAGTGGGTEPRFDLGDSSGGGEGGSGGDCPGGGGSEEYEFSIIWVANTTEGTVSKIDTQTATELARYRTGPGNPDPSRTSVNLLGDVAIANRHGSVTKIASDEDRCQDINGDGAITTSQGPGDILDWGQDECVLWHTDLPFTGNDSSNTGGPRAIAWDPGDRNNPCTSSPDLWIGWRDMPNDQVFIWRLDGSNGVSNGDELMVPDWETNQWEHGTYGGASDKGGNFWALGNLGRLVYVDAASLDHTVYIHDDLPTFYGLALNEAGDPWIGGWDGHLYHFDAAAETYEDLGQVGESTRLRGLAIDSEGHAWIAGNNPCSLIRYDTVGRMQVEARIDLPTCNEPVGVSIDVDGMVWVVDRNASRAYKVDPDDYSVVEVDGLVQPYTYSDMTGAGLGLVVGPPAG